MYLPDMTPYFQFPRSPELSGSTVYFVDKYVAQDDKRV